MALHWSKFALLLIFISMLALPGCVILLSIVSPSVPEMLQPTATSMPQQSDLLRALANQLNPSPRTVNISGVVMNNIGQPAVNVNVTLWQDGKIVDIPNNPQHTTTGWNGSDYQPYKVGIFTFPDVPNVDYEITCEKDGYYGSYSWDPKNPIPVPIMIRNPSANVTYPKLKYYNISDSQISEARALAFENQSIRQMLTGTEYSIDYVTMASDAVSPLVMKISITIGTNNYSEGNLIVTPRLLICVDLTNQKIVSIQHEYGASSIGNGWIRAISPGSYVYYFLKVYDINGSTQVHPVILSFTCPGDAAVRPMILDASNFTKFKNSEPYSVKLYGDEIVSSGWSGNFSMLSNQDYYYVLINENPYQSARVNSQIDLTVWYPTYTDELAFDYGPVVYSGGA